MENIQRSFDGMGAYQQAIDEVIKQAQRTIRIFDKDLAHSGYNSPQREESLRRFLCLDRTNQLLIVVHDLHYITRSCPRLINLLKAFSHTVHIHQTLPQAKHASDAFIIADQCHLARRFHQDQWRGNVMLNDEEMAHPFIERFNQLWEASECAISATTLGL